MSLLNGFMKSPFKAQQLPGTPTTRAEADAARGEPEPELVIRNLDTGRSVTVTEALRDVSTITPEDEKGGGAADVYSDPRAPKGYGKLDDKKQRPSLENVRVHSKNELGEVVAYGHRASVLANCLQLGIRYCVSRAESRGQVVGRGLQQDIGPPYHECYKVAFPREGSATTPRHDMASFKFKEYTPTVFRNLRSTFGVDPADFLVSLCHTLPDGTNALRIMGTPGKSGSLFFFSHDSRFIVKTLPKREAVQLRIILEQYVNYMEDNPNSLLPRFYGLYRMMSGGPSMGEGAVKLGEAVRFLVMNNIFASKLEIHTRYDLKGSTLDRRTNLSERIKLGQKAVLKDLDLLQNSDKLTVGRVVKESLMKQLRKDATLLGKLNIMDYSLLVGIHNKSLSAAAQMPGSETPQSEEFLLLPGVSRGHALEVGEHGDEHTITVKDLDHDRVLTFAPITGTQTLTRFDSVNGDVVYFLGIIDILTTYTIKKSIERGFKKEGASVLPSEPYATRFCSFLETIFE